jgi:adenosine deaminase
MTVRVAVARERLGDFLRRIPKAELHLHVEGTLEPELHLALARRNGLPPLRPDVASLRAAYDFRDLQSFLDLYYAGAAVLRTEADFHDLCAAYLARAEAEGVVRAEIFFDPQTHTARGVPFRTVIDGLDRACRAARARGTSVDLILCFLRHLPEREALETLEEALPFRDRFVGVGLDSSERGHPPEKFARVFARAKALGLRRVAHAGEEGPAAYVRDSLDLLGVERIDHGVRCLEDPALVARLARERVPLTVCPLSNVRLKGVARLADHPLRRLLDAGLAVTVNSDDPAYFGGYLGDNLVQSFEALGLAAEAGVQVARNSLEAAFVGPEERARLLGRLDAFLEMYR